ncbi:MULTISPECIES: glycine cleavage system aminomethyltransferase GcvT [Sphingobacterium]|uniref:Aminomethyltransferase n=1 Tax=Sphingobacterium athyrii TaxID=2152717 RepID=A0A363NQH8_9SPHI|nr:MULTISPECIES: glycine cleavage system aminomethyltransferase GcvT [Sphingobacterium]PUV23055.1 glycine cleavage system aminomethyltransferase GcvT [Sphingobacterium athyrii]QIH31418.1 glycine cleavage system aminomethyltransferase GcvT [Sphingobacterium sp. DR205]
MLKNTALSETHIALGAKMVPFAGFNMPVQYTGINDEHETVRTGVGVFDVSHMGEFILKGEKALDLLQKISSNDVSKLYDGKVQYAYIPNETGGVVDDFLTYRIDDNTYFLVVNASNIEKDWNWISKYNTDGVEMKNISDQTSLFAVQGPKAADALQSLTDIELAPMEYYTFAKGTFAGVDNVLVSATGYTGAGGFEIYVANEDAQKVWDAIFEAGKAYGIKPIGLGARDTLRLEMGFCLYGNDIDDNTSPLEAGLGWVTKFTKDFVNSAALKAEKEAGLKKKLVGFEMIDRGIPRHDYEIVDADGNVIGRVTSGTQSPTLKKSVGLGYVDTAFAKDGADIFIHIRNQKVKAKVTKPPFVK